jgi:hypothetical protein
MFYAEDVSLLQPDTSVGKVHNRFLSQKRRVPYQNYITNTKGDGHSSPLQAVGVSCPVKRMSEQNTNSNSNIPQQPWDFERFARETGRTALEIARELGKMAEDASGLMLIRADRDLRTKLDMLVESGAVKTRREALEMLIKSGEVQKSRIFTQIEKTRAEIDALKKGLKGLVGNS